MSIIVSNMDIPIGCQKCKFFKKHLLGNGWLDYSYSCILGAKDFPMPWMRQINERASDCPIKPLEQEHCGDATSKKEVFEQINCWIGSGEYRYTNATYYLMKRIRDIPSVT